MFVYSAFVSIQGADHAEVTKKTDGELDLENASSVATSCSQNQKSRGMHVSEGQSCLKFYAGDQDQRFAIPSLRRSFKHEP